MLKNFGKKMLMGLMCSSILICTSMPAFASNNVSANGRAKTATFSAATVSSDALIDGSSCTKTITGGGRGVFSVTVNDTDMRNLIVSSSAKVKTVITPASSGLGDLISYNSGTYRSINQIGWHFLVGIQYNIIVVAETTADVTVSMSKSNSISWINQGATTTKESNLIYGGQAENYAINLETGTYRITVKATTKLTASYGSEAILLSGASHSFYTTSDASKNPYILSLESTDAVNTGGAYTVTIEKL